MHPRTPTPARSLSDHVVLLVFALAIALPGAGRVLDPHAGDSARAERRTARPFPRVRLEASSLAVFPDRFELWWNDTFGFRGPLIRAHNLLKIYGFGVPPSNSLILGPDQWIFVTANRAIEAYRGVAPLSEAELQAWRNVLASRAAWLNTRDCEYVFVVAPDKPSVYDEYLPAGVTRGERTMMDQLIEHVSQDSGCLVVDVRDALQRAKRLDSGDDRVYYPYGTHWTERGAHAAYREILARLQERRPGPEGYPLWAYELLAVDHSDDHWGATLHIEDRLPPGSVVLRPHFRSRARIETIGSDTVWTGPDERLPRAVVLHDSFGPALFPFLAEHFSYMRTIGTLGFDPERVAAEDPDVVIQVIAERRLAAYLPSSAPTLTDSRDAFESAPAVVWNLASAEALAQCEGWRGAELEPQGPDGTLPLLLKRSKPAEGLLTPPVDMPSGTSPVLRLVIESPRAQALTLLFRTPSSPEYHPGKAARVELEEGMNELHLQLVMPGIEGPLLVVPTGLRGNYVIHEFELRARPTGS